MKILYYKIILEMLFIMIVKTIIVCGLPREIKFTGTVWKLNRFLWKKNQSFYSV